MTNAQQNTNSSPGLLERQGIQGSLKWGFLAVMIFMAGNSLELGFISPFLQDRGLSASQVSVMLTVYGAVVAVASWLSGAPVSYTHLFAPPSAGRGDHTGDGLSRCHAFTIAGGSPGAGRRARNGAGHGSDASQALPSAPVVPG